jgi:hypothetical protein
MKHATLNRAPRSRRAPGFRGFAPALLLSALAACGDSSGSGGNGGGGAGAAGGAGDGGSGGGVVIEQPNRFRVRLDDAPVPALVLELDKEDALKLFGEDGASQITALEVDTTALLTNAVNQIQVACGTAWRNDATNPNHNCASTPVFRPCPPGSPECWRTSPEFALVRLLTMTPANADVTGTSLEELKQIFDDNPGVFTFDFAGILADSLGIARTDPFVPTDKLVIALQQQLLGTHPAIPDATGVTMPVTLYEALSDLAPLSRKLGPSGAHPGVLVPDDDTFTTKSNVLEGFRMRVVAESALRRVAGIDLSKGGGDMFLKEGDAPLRFDFNDPDKLTIEGIAETPTVDLRFSMHELTGIVPSCTDPTACKSNYPTTPVGTGTVWTVPPFLLEPVVAKAAFLSYGDRRFTGCYFRSGATCRVGVNIGQGSDPAGWTQFLGNIAFPPDPPPRTPDPQFLWELLTEIAQVAVHDPTGDGAPDIAEGAAQPVYTLHNVGIGMTRAEIIAELRPTLQRQAQQIADIILGRYWLENDALDFYYSRGAPGGDPYLFFVAEDDLRPDDQGSDTPRAYGYTKPGFFSSPDLGEASKVSSKAVDGIADTTHEKYKLAPGANTLYAQDDEGATYEVQLYVPENGDPVEITADVKRL